MSPQGARDAATLSRRHIPTPNSKDMQTNLRPNTTSVFRQPELTTFSELPSWHQDNPFIHSGYRPAPLPSHRLCVASWLYLHNESVNIFSHLIPSVLSVVVGYASYEYFFRAFPLANMTDWLVLVFFLASATICLAISAGYHTLMCHSQEVSEQWVRYDFVGILVLIEGFFVSGIYVGFYCEPHLQKIYWTMILSLGAVSGYIIVNPRYQGPRYRTFRLTAFIGTGLSAFLPIIHGLLLFGWSQMNKQAGLQYYLIEGAVCAFGAWLYNTRIPESIWPGKFDIWGSSHQLFHILVVIAGLIHLFGIGDAFEYNYRTTRCAAGGEWGNII